VSAELKVNPSQKFMALS